LSAETLVFLDTETTGLDFKNEQIIEIGAVKVTNGEIVESFSSLVKPTVPIKSSSFKIHGITDEELDPAPSIEEVLPKFLEFMGDLPYAAHNAIFDYSFINQAKKGMMSGEKFSNQRIDTLDMYRSVFPDEPSHSLSSLLARFGFESHVTHRALDDAMNLARVYPQLRQRYEQKLAWQFSQLKNIHYLVERYLRIQKVIQGLQAEMSDLKEIFKLHFNEGGGSLEASSGETLVTSYKRSYSYDEKGIWRLLKDTEYAERVFKLNPRPFEKLLDRGNLTEELKEKLNHCRTGMFENRMVTFVKPQPVLIIETPADPEEE
jgi:DNA polymerase-3 subunit alpha (Gram-positive type)